MGNPATEPQGQSETLSVFDRPLNVVRECEQVERSVRGNYEKDPKPETAKQDALAFAVKQIREDQSLIESTQEGRTQGLEEKIFRLTKAIVATGGGDWGPMKDLILDPENTFSFGDPEITEDQAIKTLTNLKASL